MIMFVYLCVGIVITLLVMVAGFYLGQIFVLNVDDDTECWAIASWILSSLALGVLITVMLVQQGVL